MKFRILFLVWSDAQFPLCGTEPVDRADWQTGWGIFDKNTTGSLAFKSHRAPAAETQEAITVALQPFEVQRCRACL